MTSEVEERPRFVTGGYGWHRSQWVNVGFYGVTLYVLQAYSLRFNALYVLRTYETSLSFRTQFIVREKC